MNINDELRELELMLQKENERKNEAKQAQERADKIKEAAIVEEKKSEEKVNKLNEAKVKLEDYKASLADLGVDYYSQNEGNKNSTVVEEEKKEENKDTTEEVINSTRKVNNDKTCFITGLLAGALLISFVGGGIVLVKESKTGKIKNTEANLLNSEDGKYEYNYGENVVTVKGDKEYVPLTTEKFEELCTNVIRKFENLGISASHEDIIKFVTVYNINKLRQDNPGLVRDVMGTQTVLEVFDDACAVSDVLKSYEAQNLIYNGQILSVADCVFDEEQQQLIRDFEAKKLEIVLADQCDRERMTEEWLYSLLDAQSEFKLFDDASLLLVLRHCVVPIDSTYFKDETYHTTLTGNAREYMMQMIAPYFDASEEQMRKCVASCSEIKMMDSFSQCVELENTKTLTK